MKYYTAESSQITRRTKYQNTITAAKKMTTTTKENNKKKTQKQILQKKHKYVTFQFYVSL